MLAGVPTKLVIEPLTPLADLRDGGKPLMVVFSVKTVNLIAALKRRTLRTQCKTADK
jgi:hypothetical protein